MTIKKTPLPNREDNCLEAQQLKLQHQYDILDTPREQKFDELTHLAAQICGTPISSITLVDEKRHWVKSRIGLKPLETPRDVSFLPTPF